MEVRNLRLKTENFWFFFFSFFSPLLILCFSFFLFHSFPFLFPVNCRKTHARCLLFLLLRDCYYYYSYYYEFSAFLQMVLVAWRGRRYRGVVIEDARVGKKSNKLSQMTQTPNHLHKELIYKTQLEISVTYWLNYIHPYQLIIMYYKRHV